MDNTHVDSAPVPYGPSGPRDHLRALGEYRLLRRLGEGGMGEVYLGFNERLGRQVAVKVLADHLSSDQTYVDRFYREAKSGALLNHPNIVHSLNVGRDQTTGKHYLVLEYVEGISAHVLLNELGKLPVGDAVHIVLDVARALEHAHSRNIVHRDIKPDNILLSRSGVAKLVDFGLAKRTDETSHLTATRQAFGTTPYMPYEQAIDAKRADGRSDIYALGATFYHLLTGSVPFPGNNHVEVVERKNRGQFEPARSLNPDVPPELDRILERMMAREPRQRYQTASELIVELERSGLAAAVPSFADPEQAKNDPWMQQYLASSAEPTQLDPNSPPRRPAPSSLPLDDRWVVRVRLKSGKWRKYHATTPQILQKLREGKMPAQVEAGKNGDDFHPLSYYPLFQHITSLTKAGARRGASAPKVGDPSDLWDSFLAVRAASSRRKIYFYVAGGVLIALACVAGLLYLLAF